MDKSGIDNELIIERYILGQLTEQQETEFESYYLSNQQCLDQLEITEKLYQGLKLQESDHTLHNQVFNRRQQAANDASWWKSKIPVWAVAAMLMLAILPSIVLQMQLQPETNSGLVSMTSISLSELRSISTTEVVIDSEKGRKILAFYIDTNMSSLVYPHYSFEVVSRDDPEETHLFADLKLNEVMSTLYVDLGEHLLNKGQYQFVLAGNTSPTDSIVLKKGLLEVE